MAETLSLSERKAAVQIFPSIFIFSCRVWHFHFVFYAPFRLCLSFLRVAHTSRPSFTFDLALAVGALSLPSLVLSLSPRTLFLLLKGGSYFDIIIRI
jgi:hypothetical protein